MMLLRLFLSALAILVALGAPVLTLPAHAAGTETLTEARYATPVERYGHFALGRPHEYARLTAVTSRGRTLTLDLAEDEVFEDLAPRLVKLAAGGAPELLTIISRRSSGARLALIRLAAEGLVISAQSPAIGTPQRWLNPVGVLDLDGDGRAEIAAVITPHIGGTLKVYQRRGSELVETAALAGFSNHVYGSAELRLSVADGRRLLVPDAARRSLRIVTLQQGRLIEVGRCALAAPVVGEIKLISPDEAWIGLATGAARIKLGDCR